MTEFLPAFLDEIRNRLPLSGIVGSRMRLIRAGREFKGCCPFHNEKTPSFYVNDDKQFFHCFGCGAHGDVIGFTMRHDRLSFPEAVEALAAQAGLAMPQDTPIEREKFDREKHLHLMLDRVAGWFEEQLFAPVGREGLAYLHGRGLSDEAIRRFRLGYAPGDAQALIRALTKEGFKLEDLVATGVVKKSEERDGHYSFFRNRVMFPVGDRRGRVVAFGGRVLGDGEPKYLNSPDHILFHKGQLLYGLSRARAASGQGQPIIVVEGYMDAISLAEAGYTGAVAPLGTALTEDQMQALWRLLPSLEARDAGRDYSPILCFDGDNAGLRAAARATDRALPLLTAAQTFRVATITGAKDPDELIRRSGKGAFDAILQQALPMIDMVWNLALTGRQVRTPEERAAFAAALRERVRQIKDETLRRLYGEEYKKRLDAAFGYQPRAQNASNGKYNGKGRGDWKGRAPQQPERLINRSAPPSKLRMMEKILLALMINHPALFDVFGERFAAYDMQTPDFAPVHRKLIDCLTREHDEAITPAELRRALADTDADEDRVFFEDGSGALDEILSPDTYMHAKGAAPEAEADSADKAWRETWAAHEIDQLRAEHARARALYGETPSDENYARMLALQAQIERAQRGEF